MSEPTILIVGAGTFGTSAAYYLAQSYRDTSRITIIDRWSPSHSGNRHAAAIDVNRVIRTDYTSPLYCELANEAIHPWFWSLELGQYFHKTGWIVLDKDSGYSESVRKIFQNRGGDYTKNVSVKDMIEKWQVIKGLETNRWKDAYFNPEAGWCDAEQATAQFMAAALERGVKRVTGDVVELLFNKSAGRLEGVRTADRQHYLADKVLLATGAWTSSLLSPIEDVLGISSEDRIEKQVQAVGRISAYYTLSQGEADSISRSGLPIVVFGEDCVLVPPSSQNRTLKLNDLKTEFTNFTYTNTGHKISTPASRYQLDVPQKLRRESEQLLASIMPDFVASRTPDRWRICWDAKTPTEDWLMCEHPHPQLCGLYLAVGGSFHSYKFMPILGKYIRNTLEGRGNGEERDKAWAWKRADESKEMQRKEIGVKPITNVKRTLKEFEGDEPPSKL